MNRKFKLTALLLATLSGAAMAQSTVTVFGSLDAMASRFTGSAAGVNSADKATKRIDSGGMSTSHLGLRGSEDLGGGLAASFELSGFLRNDTGETGRSNAIGAPVNVAADPMWSRAAWVGLTSKTLGRVRMGNGTSLLFLNSITSNAFVDSTVFSPINLVTFIGSPLTGGTGWTNQIMIDSPNLAGFTASASVSAGEGQGGRNVAGRVSYAGGPVAAAFAYQTVKKNPATFADGTSPNNTKAWQLAGSYDFNVAKVFAHIGRIQNDGTEAAPLDVNYKIWDLSASVPISTGYLLAGYASRTTGDAVGPVPATVAGGNKERKVFSIGYDYFLSKRTDVYAMLMHDRTVTNSLPAPPKLVTASATNVGVGIRHRF
ncbi:MAG TPA: porin [Burkholderiaceae bacterium]|nr:porin [Burkholderiaceae bacterium]